VGDKFVAEPSAWSPSLLLRKTRL